MEAKKPATDPMSKLGADQGSSVYTPPAKPEVPGGAPPVPSMGGIIAPSKTGLVGQPSVAEAMSPTNQVVVDRIKQKKKDQNKGFGAPTTMSTSNV